MIISGGSDGLIAVSSPTTGMTVRVISDHKGAPIINIDVTNKQVCTPKSALFLLFFHFHNIFGLCRKKTCLKINL